MSETKLFITSSDGNSVLEPDAVREVRWITYRRGNAGKIVFKLANAAGLDFSEGGTVRFYVDNQPLFLGYVFSKKFGKDGTAEVSAYDSMRYLMCRDVCVYENKTASELIKMLASNYGLMTGEIEESGFVIGARVEENSTVLEIMENALEITESNSGKRFVLFDSFGKLNLKDECNMRVGDEKSNLLLDETRAENFEYLTSIDNNVYNKIKLVREDKRSGKREIYIKQDNVNIRKWGSLQYFGKLASTENGMEKAKALLENYNRKRERIEMKNVFGDVRIRAGSSVAVKVMSGNEGVGRFMTVERAEHRFADGEYFMDLIFGN